MKWRPTNRIEGQVTRGTFAIQEGLIYLSRYRYSAWQFATHGTPRWRGLC
jgi:hypothetical protein